MCMSHLYSGNYRMLWYTSCGFRLSCTLCSRLKLSAWKWEMYNLHATGYLQRLRTQIMHYSSQLRSLWSQMLFSLGDYFTPTRTFKRWSMKWSAADWIPRIRGRPLTECLCLIHWGRQPTLQYSEPLNMNRCFWQKKERNTIYGIHKHASTSGKQFILRADGNLADAEGR